MPLENLPKILFLSPYLNFFSNSSTFYFMFMLAYVVCRLCCFRRVWQSITDSRRETRGAGRSGDRRRRRIRKRRQVSSIPYVYYDWSQVRLNIKFARLRDFMRQYTEGLRETIDWSHVACRFTVRLAYYQTLLIDETEMGMRPGQCGMCWCKHYRGGRPDRALSWWHLGFGWLWLLAALMSLKDRVLWCHLT